MRPKPVDVRALLAERSGRVARGPRNPRPLEGGTSPVESAAPERRSNPLSPAAGPHVLAVHTPLTAVANGNVPGRDEVQVRQRIAGRAGPGDRSPGPPAI